MNYPLIKGLTFVAVFWLFTFLLLFPSWSNSQGLGDCPAIQYDWDHVSERENGNPFDVATELENYEVEISVDNFATSQIVQTGKVNQYKYRPTVCDGTEQTYQARAFSVDTESRVSKPSEVASIVYNGSPIDMSLIFAKAPSGLSATQLIETAPVPDCSDTERWSCSRKIVITDTTVIESN